MKNNNSYCYSNPVMFYDTSALLELDVKGLSLVSDFLISDITLQELEELKNSSKKTPELRQCAQRIISFLAKAEYKVIYYNKRKMKHLLKEYPDYRETNDGKIVSCAIAAKKIYRNVCLRTSDLSMFNIARPFISTILISHSQEEENKYKGYKIINFTEEELANFYANELKDVNNPLGLLTNEYLLIKNSELDDEAAPIIDKYLFTGTSYEQISFKSFESTTFGTVKPKDDIQAIAMDSLSRNQLTVLRGPAGSGKSYLAISYLFSLLDKRKIDKIIIFCNTVATVGSAKLGFYPGSRIEKLMDSSIGNFLASKLGDSFEVERLIEQHKLVLLPMSDIRGYDTTGMNAGIYITEAQNLDISLMKLALQRIGEDSICILDGDDEAQVDMEIYAGDNNGLKRVSKVFSGADFYGEVTLQQIHRSKIAELAQKM